MTNANCGHSPAPNQAISIPPKGERPIIVDCCARCLIDATQGRDAQFRVHFVSNQNR